MEGRGGRGFYLFTLTYSAAKQRVPQKRSDAELLYLIGWGAEFGGSLIWCPGAPHGIKESQRVL